MAQHDTQHGTQHETRNDTQNVTQHGTTWHTTWHTTWNTKWHTKCHTTWHNMTYNMTHMYQNKEQDTQHCEHSETFLHQLSATFWQKYNSRDVNLMCYIVKCSPTSSCVTLADRQTDRQTFYWQKDSQSRLICHTCIYNIGNLLKSYDNIHSMTYITKITLTGIAIRNTGYILKIKLKCIARVT